jgi:hypothetical protein
MSCAYRTHRYRASVTAHPASVSWGLTTGHAQHPIPLRPPVVYPHRQAVTATSTPTDDAPIPVRLIQYLWSRWQVSPSERDAIAAAVGALMLSPRWHWNVTVLPDHSPPDPQSPFVSERAERPTIGMPIAMLRDLWRWVLDNIDERAAVLRWWTPIIDPALWQELRTHQQTHGPPLTEQDWYRLYGYLSPVLLPDIVRETRHLLSSADPDDHQMALTVLERWMASPDSATRDLATQILHAWLHARPADGTVTDVDRQLWLRAITILASSDDPAVVSTHLYHLLRTAWDRITPDDVRTIIDLLHGCGDGRPFATGRWMSLLGEMVRDHPSDDVIREVLDRLIPAILPSARPDVRVRWAATLWNRMTDSTLDEWRRWMIATALTPMMQEPMVAALVHAQLCTDPSLLQTLPTSIGDTLLAGLMRTVCADEVLRMIEQEIRQNPNTIARFDPIVAAGWGHGHDHRILQMVTAHPSPHWQMVLAQGSTTSVGSVGAAVCDRIGSWFPRNQAMAMIAIRTRAREELGDWPLAPLPAHLIPWVCDAARSYHLHPTTIRRLWLANPKQAWNVTQTMLHSDDPSVQVRALEAMDAGWGRGHDGTLAATLREFILHARNPTVIEPGIATAIAGIGRADPFLIASLLTELAMNGDETIQFVLARDLHRGWGRGQDDLVVGVLAIIADRTSSGWVWNNDTLIRSWDYLPPHVVVSLVDQLVTRATDRLAKDEPYRSLGPWGVQPIIVAFAPGWTHLPTAHMIERIAHHVARLHAHAHTLAPAVRNTLVFAWAAVIMVGVERLSASDIHALLAPLWTLSPDWCLDGVVQGVR